MAIDFLKTPPPEEASKPKHFDFWKPDLAPPLPAISDEEKLRLEEDQLAKEKAEFEAEKKRIEEEEAQAEEKPVKKRKG